MIGLYEMIRVARKGIILIEPFDYYSSNKFKILDYLKYKVKSLLGKPVKDTYEKVGNYVYTLSLREFEKISLGLNYPGLAYRGINDHYIAGIEQDKLGSNSMNEIKVKSIIWMKDTLAKLRLMNYNLIVVAIIKDDLKTEMKECVNKTFKILDLPRNPYVK